MNALADFQDETVFFNAFFGRSFFGKKEQHQVAKDIKQLEKDWLAATHRKQIPALLNQHHTTYFGALCSFSKKVARSVSLESIAYLINQATKLNLPLNITQLCSNGKQTSHQAFITRELQEIQNHCQFEYAFVTRLPCDDGCGWISSLEVFGAEGELLLQVQGVCEDQQAENLRLRELFSSLS